jgi:hypothetical protein
MHHLAVVLISRSITVTDASMGGSVTGACDEPPLKRGTPMAKFWIWILTATAVITAVILFGLMHNLKAMRCLEEAKWEKQLDTEAFPGRGSLWRRHYEDCKTTWIFYWK